MGRPAWANDEQWAWLKSQATEYLKIKGKKNETAKFWPGFLTAWQEQWPKPALSDLVREDSTGKDSSTAKTGDGVGANDPVHESNSASVDSSTAENTDKTGTDQTDTDANAGNKKESASKKKKERKPLTVSVVRTIRAALSNYCTDSSQRLKQWMNNHTRSTSTGEGKQKMLDLTGRKAKRWQLYQAYSHLYYKEKLRPLIITRYLEYLTTVPTGEEADSVFKYRNSQLRRMLEDESDEVKAEVVALCERTLTVRDYSSCSRGSRKDVE